MKAFYGWCVRHGEALVPEDARPWMHGNELNIEQEAANIQSKPLFCITHQYSPRKYGHMQYHESHLCPYNDYKSL